MNYQEYISLLKIQTSSRPFQRQLEFAVMICKKLYFDYKDFVEVEQWGDADLLMDAINICSRVIAQSPDIAQIKELIPKIDLITPHMDDFGNNMGSYALNASAAVYETLEFIIDQDNTHIFNIGNYYTDTIDFKIQEEKDLSQQEIENHPLMIEAWNFIVNETKNGT